MFSSQCYRIERSEVRPLSCPICYPSGQCTSEVATHYVSDDSLAQVAADCVARLHPKVSVDVDSLLGRIAAIELRLAGSRAEQLDRLSISATPSREQHSLSASTTPPQKCSECESPNPRGTDMQMLPLAFPGTVVSRESASQTTASETEDSAASGSVSAAGTLDQARGLLLVVLRERLTCLLDFHEQRFFSVLEERTNLYSAMVSRLFQNTMRSAALRETQPAATSPHQSAVVQTDRIQVFGDHVLPDKRESCTVKDKDIFSTQQQMTSERERLLFDRLAAYLNTTAEILSLALTLSSNAYHEHLNAMRCQLQPLPRVPSVTLDAGVCQVPPSDGIVCTTGSVLSSAPSPPPAPTIIATLHSDTASECAPVVPLVFQPEEDPVPRYVFPSPMHAVVPKPSSRNVAPHSSRQKKKWEANPSNLLQPPWNASTTAEAMSRAPSSRLVTQPSSYAALRQRSSKTTKQARPTLMEPTCSFLESTTLRFQVQYIDSKRGLSPQRHCRHCLDRVCEHLDLH